ncbi:MAG: thiamine pyrophosphate-binding protein [Burkholderiaceae bacterium]|nr:thiamine pyrophosphate-binding protein [Burkholderiaceae bacterium]
MNIIDACRVIALSRNDAVLVSTMRAMYAFDKLDQGQPRLNAVPLMGGAPSMGLGIALAQPERKVIIVDGDASLLMQLGGLVTVANQQPKNFYHFVIFNGTQFTGISNLPIPGVNQFDFAGLAKAAGYKAVYSYSTLDELQDGMSEILGQQGPVFVVLHVEPDPPAYPAKPLKDFADHHFTRMGEEAQMLQDLLTSRPIP